MIANGESIKSALHYLNISHKPLFKIVKDKNPVLGRTLQATHQIAKGSPVVIYYGEKMTSEQNLKAYLSDPKKYLTELAPYIRGHPNNPEQSIDASKIVEDVKKHLPNVCGVIVNDVSKPKSLRLSDLLVYRGTEKECNLEPSPYPTRDYPLYIAKRKIKKGEILTVHYGLGYWLLQMGVPPQNLASFLGELQSSQREGKS